jgi:hypothetical protein
MPPGVVDGVLVGDWPGAQVGGVGAGVQLSVGIPPGVVDGVLVGDWPGAQVGGGVVGAQADGEVPGVPGAPGTPGVPGVSVGPQTAGGVTHPGVVAGDFGMPGTAFS